VLSSFKILVKLFGFSNDNIIAFCYRLRKAAEGWIEKKMSSKVDRTLAVITNLRFRAAKVDDQQRSRAIQERLTRDHLRKVRPEDNPTKLEAQIILRQPEDLEVKAIKLGSPNCSLVLVTPSGFMIDGETFFSHFKIPQKDVTHYVLNLERAGRDKTQQPLDILGEIQKVRLGNYCHKVVTGLTATPMVVEVLDATLGKERYHVNERGVVVNVKPEDQQNILEALDNKFGFGLRFIESQEAATIIRKVKPIIEAKEIKWFLTEDKEGYNLTVVNNFFSTPAKHDDHDDGGGLVFIR
jgi:hypothetical protein